MPIHRSGFQALHSSIVDTENVDRAEAQKYEPTQLRFVMSQSMLLSLLVPLEFLLPGYAWIRFSGLKRRFGIMETLAISFILSVSFTSLFTAGLSLVTSHYLSYSVAGSLGFSLILLVASLRNRKIDRSSLPKLNRTMFPVVATACVYVIVLASVFWSSPYYPTADAFDPIAHAQVVQAISSGLARTTLLHSDYAIGMHFVAAVLARLLGVDSLVAIRFLLVSGYRGLHLLDLLLCA